MSKTYQLIELMRRQQRMLFSPEIQFALEQDPDELKRVNFVKERQRYVSTLQNLEKQNLEHIAEKMKSLEPELENAISELEQELQSINNTIRILRNISNVSRVASQILMFI